MPTYLLLLLRVAGTVLVVEFTSPFLAFLDLVLVTCLLLGVTLALVRVVGTLLVLALLFGSVGAS